MSRKPSSNSSPELPSTSQNTSVLDFYRGEALFGFAGTYDTVQKTILEAIQNALDAEGTRILIGIDLRSRNVFIYDNGMGVDKQQFDLALKSVGRTVKRSDKIGQFGRGLIAPLNKCKRFTFTSKRFGYDTVRQWTFVGSDIIKQQEEIIVPVVVLKDLPAIPRWLMEHAIDDFAADWRTVIMMNGIVEDKVISLVDLDDLESKVRQKYGKPMIEMNVRIRVVMIEEKDRLQLCDINPVDHTGEPLPEVHYQDAMVGDVTFELYRAPKRGGHRTGKVIIMPTGSKSVITMPEFIRQARGGEWGEIIDPALKALNSGYFEGYITAKNIEILPDREKFAYTEALQALYLMINAWYEEHGKTYLEGEQMVSLEERYQLLGIQSQQRIRDILLRPEYERLWSGLTDVVAVGRLGHGHLEPQDGTPNGPDASKTVRSGQGGAGHPAGASTSISKPPGERVRPPKDRSGDIPTGVVGPRGNNRQLIQGDSQGLWFEHAWMDGNTHLWEFDFEMGVLTFNVRHTVWLLLSETNGRITARNNRMIMELQEFVTLELLALLSVFKSADDLEEHRKLLDIQIRPYVEMSILNRRR